MVMPTALTIFRFSHAYDVGAGLEYDIDAVVHALAARRPIRTVYLHAASNDEPAESSEQLIGLGSLVHYRAPQGLGREISPKSALLPDRRQGRGLLSRTIRRIVASGLFGDRLYRFIAAFYRSAAHPSEIPSAGSLAERLFDQYRPDLVVMHSVGGDDARQILRLAARRGIPSLVVLHFANERFSHLSVRIQVAYATAVAGVSSIGVPRYLKSRFHDLGTGISEEAYSATFPESDAVVSELPTIVSPGRIVPEKGQLDLIHAAAILRSGGLRFRISLPGRCDNPSYASKLREAIDSAGLSDSVVMPGLLTPPELRGVYSRSAILAVPTYHEEGCPRVILEAMALALPTVVYNTGGAAAAVRDGVTGYVVPTGDVEVLAARLGHLLRDADLRSRFGSAGRSYVRSHYSLNALADRHEALYSKILGGTLASRP